MKKNDGYFHITINGTFGFVGEMKMVHIKDGEEPIAPVVIEYDNVTYTSLDGGCSFDNYLAVTNANIKQTVYDICIELGWNVNLNFLDVSAVTDMNRLFEGSLFTGRIDCWDVSNVKSMYSMFYISGFNGDISKWDVSNNEDFGYMFAGSSFNQDISGWDVSRGKYFNGMFSSVTFNSVLYNSAFNQDISGWSVTYAKSFRGMFQGNTVFNQDISGWDMSNMKYIDISIPSEFEYPLWEMFNGATSFNQDLSPWCVQNIPIMPTNFDTGATAWILPKPNWGQPC